MIKVNGHEFELSDAQPLDSWLRDNGIDSSKVAIELNGNIIQQSKYASTIIKDNDTLEIVTFMGGG
jgi:sulfur carrier protein